MTDLSKLRWAERVNLASAFVKYGELLLSTGARYRWAGDDPMTGFDCSGFVVECLKSMGFLRESEDLTADGIYRRFKDDTVQQPTKGCLVLYPREDRMYHVGIYYDNDRYLTAEGGGSHVTTPEEAAEHNAFLKARPVYSRPNPVFLDIFQIRRT